MRFTAALVAGSLAMVASAQQSSATVSVDPAQASVASCLEDCDPTDVNCLARCNPVPSPNDDQAIATNECVGECEQGDGTEAETQAYIECKAKCIKQNYFDENDGTPVGSGGSNGGSNEEDGDDAAQNTVTSVNTATMTMTTTDTVATETDGSETDSSEETGTGTETGDAATETGGDGEGAASGLFASTAALVGAIAAVFAL